MERCPACDRVFNKLGDFPIVYISSFSRLEIPEFIGGASHGVHPEREVQAVNRPIPEEVLKLFQESGKKAISHKGVLYTKLKELHSDGVMWYQSLDDVTGIVKNAIALPEVQDSLAALENSVGKEMPTKDILELPAFGRELKIGKYDDLRLSCYDESKAESGLRVAVIKLWGGLSGGSISVAEISQDLARLCYEGRARKQ